MRSILRKIFSEFNLFFFKYIINDKKKYIQNIPVHKIKILKWIKTENIKSFLPNVYIENKDYFFWKNNLNGKLKSISDYSKYNINYKSMFQIFEEGISFKLCDEYLFKSEKILKNGRTDRGQTKIKELDDYFEKIIKVKKDIEKSGYKSQQNLKENNIYDEIGVFIDANGKIIKAEDKFGGTHRFAIAKILKLKKILVCVKAIHVDFFEKLDIQKYEYNNIKNLIELINNQLKNYE